MTIILLRRKLLILFELLEKHSLQNLVDTFLDISNTRKRILPTHYRLPWMEKHRLKHSEYT